jgi:hypothetical protein
VRSPTTPCPPTPVVTASRPSAAGAPPARRSAVPGPRSRDVGGGDGAGRSGRGRAGMPRRPPGRRWRARPATVPGRLPRPRRWHRVRRGGWPGSSWFLSVSHPATATHCGQPPFPPSGQPYPLRGPRDEWCRSARDHPEILRSREPGERDVDFEAEPLRHAGGQQVGVALVVVSGPEDG